LGSAHEVEREVSPRIISLLPRRFPSDISGLIVSVIADSSERHALIPSATNITQEIGKAVQPAVAYLYAAPAVFRVFRVSLTQAPPLHFQPSPILFGDSFE
jgi:hypothetical protein